MLRDYAVTFVTILRLNYYLLLLLYIITTLIYYFF